MARENSSYALGCTQFVIGPGATLAQYVKGEHGEISHALQYFTGGSVEIVHRPLLSTADLVGYTSGSLWTGASLAALSGTGYPLVTGAAYNIDGPASYYLIAQGATTTVYKLISYSQGR